MSTRQAWLASLLLKRKPLPKPLKQKKSAPGQAYLFDGIKPACDLSKAERLLQQQLTEQDD